jgi:hypothetical protein
MKVASFNGVSEDLKSLGYEVVFLEDCKKNEKGFFILPEKKAVIRKRVYDDDCPYTMFISVSGDIKLGREMNKSLKSKGYYTNVLKVRKNIITFTISNEL